MRPVRVEYRGVRAKSRAEIAGFAMRVPLKALCDKLGVGRALSPYETQPWAHADEDRALTCSAEVRMGPDLADLEAEIQMLREEEEDESGEGEGEGGSGGPPPGVPEQVMILHAKPATGEWEVKVLTVKGQDYVHKFSEWDEKGCNFFRACVKALEREEIPDIDKLIAEELSDDDFFGSGRRGKVGRKSPKANPAALLGMKK